MKTPDSDAKAVEPKLSRIPREREVFDFTTQVSPFFALEKDYENYDIKNLLRHLFTNTNYVDSANPLKTRKYFEFILVDTGSIGNRT